MSSVLVRIPFQTRSRRHPHVAEHRIESQERGEPIQAYYVVHVYFLSAHVFPLFAVVPTLRVNKTPLPSALVSLDQTRRLDVIRTRTLECSTTAHIP